MIKRNSILLIKNIKIKTQISKIIKAKFTYSLFKNHLIKNFNSYKANI